MGAYTFFDILLIFVTVIVTFLAVLIGGFSLYLLQVYRKYEHIPSPPRKGLKGFFLGHANNIKEERKKHGFFVEVLLQWCEDLGETYVLIILGKALIVTVNQEAVKELLVNGNHLKSVLGYEALAKLYGERMLGNGLVTETRHDVWAKRRASLNPAFHRKILKTLMDDFNGAADGFMDYLAEKAEGKNYITLLNELNRVTLDVIAKVAFGMDINSIKDPTSPFPSAVFMVLKGFSEIVKSNFRKFIPFLDRPFKQEVWKAIKFLRKTGKEVLLARMEAIEAGDIVPNDFLTFAVEAKREDPSTDMETFLDDFVTFFIAGQETTANTLAFIIRELGRNPAVLERIREEVDNVIGERTSVLFEDLTKLEYTSMVIKEGLRLYPPASVTFRDASRDLNIGGYHVPKDSCVVLSSYISSRSTISAGPDALTFDPSRFSVDSPKKPATYTYMPFSLGPRSCIGMNFAQIEAKVILAKFIQRFDFELDPTQSFEIEENTTLRPKDGTRVTLNMRNV